MADNVAIKDASNVTVTVLADEVTDATMGVGEAQFVKLMDGTLGSTNKGSINSDGTLNVRAGAGSATIGKVDQGVANATPWNENIAQFGGTAVAVKAVPTGGSGQAAIPVYHNAIQELTYTVGARAIATGTLTASTAKQLLSLEVAAAGTKTVKLRRILIAGYCTTAVIGTFDIQVTRGTVASTGGTAITPGVRVAGDAAATTVVKSLPTITAATVLDTIPLTALAAATAAAIPLTVIYDWQEGGETKAWTLKPGVIDSFVLSAISSAAQAWTLTIHVTFTEE